MRGIAAPTAAAKVGLIFGLIRRLTISDHAAGMKITLSAGVAEIPVAGGIPEALLRAADAALYRAKHKGRDQVCEAETRLRLV